MAEYYLTPEAFQTGKETLAKRGLAMAIVLLLGGLSYGYWALHADKVVLLAMGVLLIGVSIYSYFRNLKQHKLTIETYRLLIDSDSISRSLANMPIIRLAASEVISITQNAQGNLAITSTDKYRAIYVPVQVTHRAELLHELERFAPLTIVERKTWAERLGLFTVVGMMGIMWLFYTVNNKVISTIAGTLLLGILSWSSWHIYHNKNLPQQARRLLWFMPLLMLSTIGGIITRLLQ